MEFESKAEMLDYILNEFCKPDVEFDYDDVDDGVAYITTENGEFKITIEKIS